MQVKLTVRLKDGRVLSGTYHYLGAVERLEQARRQPDFDGYDWEVL